MVGTEFSQENPGDTTGEGAAHLQWVPSILEMPVSWGNHERQWHLRLGASLILLDKLSPAAMAELEK